MDWQELERRSFSSKTLNYKRRYYKQTYMDRSCWVKEKKNETIINFKNRIDKMAIAKLNGKWKRVKTIKRSPYSSSVTIKTGNKTMTIPRTRYKIRKSDRK